MGARSLRHLIGLALCISAISMATAESAMPPRHDATHQPGDTRDSFALLIYSPIQASRQGKIISRAMSYQSRNSDTGLGRISSEAAEARCE